MIYGSPERLSTSPLAPQQFHQDTINVDDAAESGDRFGFSLSAWDFGKNEIRQVCNPDFCIDVPVRTSDLAIGVPFEDVGGASNAGGVNVLFGRRSSVNGLSTTGDQFWTQSSAGVPGASEASDQFGASVY